VSVLDRLAYPIYEPLTILAAVAGVTERLRLMTNVVLAPTRNPFLLAKQAATVHQISRGRLVLGLGVGRRQDDFDAVGQSFHDRGRRFDLMLEQLARLWGGETGGEPAVPAPLPAGRVPLLIGGENDRTPLRVARWGIGWTSGGGRELDEVAVFAGRVRAAWQAEGRTGAPRILALCYFSVGEAGRSRDQTLDYYGFQGPKAEIRAAATPHDASAILEIRDRSAQRGIDELTFMPTLGDPDQVDKLARIVFG
jgi:alkanesulfonate monooxygenase SsuD/methylene tetrahydromethanopterin reductase-like flavin-dependent oxidoreductase (luciferase family)